MYSSTLAVVLLCTAGIGFAEAQPDPSALAICNDLYDEDLDAPFDDPTPTQMREEICPLLRERLRCMFRAAGHKPSSHEIRDLETVFQNFLKQTNYSKQIEVCALDLQQLSDEVWNSAGAVRPLSLLAVLTVVALLSFFSIHQGL